MFFWDAREMLDEGLMPSILAIGDSWFWHPFPGGSLVNGLGAVVRAKEHNLLAGDTIRDPDHPETEVNGSWITFVRGFMTIGSPIDKHIALWPKLSERFRFNSSIDDLGGITIRQALRQDAPPVKLARKIQWRNYFDFGDPIGFNLESTVGSRQKPAP
jgi:hypothetical protein